MKRVLLFVLTNVAVMVVLSAVVYLLGLDKYLSGRGGMGGLLVVAAIFGFGGAFISLAMSKSIAKRSTGAQVITQPRSQSAISQSAGKASSQRLQWRPTKKRAKSQQARVG